MAFTTTPRAGISLGSSGNFSSNTGHDTPTNSINTTNSGESAKSAVLALWSFAFNAASTQLPSTRPQAITPLPRNKPVVWNPRLSLMLVFFSPRSTDTPCGVQNRFPPYQRSILRPGSLLETLDLSRLTVPSRISSMSAYRVITPSMLAEYRLHLSRSRWIPRTSPNHPSNIVPVVSSQARRCRGRVH